MTDSAKASCPGGRSPSGRFNRIPCKDHLKSTCANPSFEKWYSSEFSFYKFAEGCKFENRCAFAHRRVKEQPHKRSKRSRDKSTAALLKETKNLGNVFQDRQDRHRFYGRAQPRRNQSHVSDLPGQYCAMPNFEIKICRSTQFAIGDSHQRSPNAPNFEETEWQEHWARGAAWKLAKEILKSKETHKATFFSPTEKWCLPSPSKIKLEEREFVVDSAAPMHMISRKELNSAELETVRNYRCPTSIITANGEVKTHEEATVYVRELDMFLTVQILEDTAAVLSLGKLCEDHGYSYEWANGKRPCLIKNGVRI